MTAEIAFRRRVARERNVSREGGFVRLDQHLQKGIAQSDFLTLLREKYPYLVPGILEGEMLSSAPDLNAPHGTTILALRYGEGVVISGDRQATFGYEVADRSIQKVFATDEYSAIAIAGVAGPAVQMAKLLTTQLEFYEKVEGTVLSLEGKANYLGLMLRQNLPAAMQGLVVVPIFAGYDLRKREGRIFKYDVTGGKYEETEYTATGSGGKDARSTLKKRFRPQLSRDEAVRFSVEALLDAGEEDLATGGIDFVRGIYPSVKTVTREGIRDVPDDEIRRVAESLIDELRRTLRRANDG
jgi:proteasome beta subunit